MVSFKRALSEPRNRNVDDSRGVADKPRPEALPAAQPRNHGRRSHRSAQIVQTTEVPHGEPDPREARGEEPNPDGSSDSSSLTAGSGPARLGGSSIPPSGHADCSIWCTRGDMGANAGILESRRADH